VRVSECVSVSVRCRASDYCFGDLIYTHMFVLEFIHVDNKCLKLLFFPDLCVQQCCK
jgi:hypothetical protein